jgi:predicted nuclease of predicted toxin-antitoxin system
MQAASDDAIFDRAEAENRIVVSADTDFATLLAARRSPSLVLFRHGSQHRPNDQSRAAEREPSCFGGTQPRAAPDSAGYDSA